jgi:hypothetical protein
MAGTKLDGMDALIRFASCDARELICCSLLAQPAWATSELLYSLSGRFL